MSRILEIPILAMQYAAIACTILLGICITYHGIINNVLVNFVHGPLLLIYMGYLYLAMYNKLTGKQILILSLLGITNIVFLFANHTYLKI